MELISRTADRINFHFRNARERRLAAICFAQNRTNAGNSSVLFGVPFARVDRMNFR